MSSLVFFDTFSHESSDVPKLDLVQFPKAVHVSEVRVIPLGARVKADFPGGVRLGATNPSQFVIDFFVNDCGKRGATTFENVGQLQYNQQGPIKLDFEKTPPTDGLLLRGCYNTITLAVYGTLSRAIREPPPKSPPPPPPPVPVSPPPTQPPARHPARPPTSPCSPGKRDGVVSSPPLPHPLPQKVNPNERIRDWLQDTQVPQSPLDLDQSPTKDVWEDPSLDGDQCKEELSPAPPPPSPPPSHPSQPHSPPHSPSPDPHSRPSHSRVSSSERSQRRRTQSSREQSRDRGHERSIEIYDRTVDCSLDGTHDRSVERSHNRSRDRSERDGDRVGRNGRDRHERHKRTSRDRSRELSERRSLSLARSQALEGKDAGEGEGTPRPREGGRSREKRDKKTKDGKRSREDRRDRRRQHEEWTDSSGSHRRSHHRRHSTDSLQEAGPRTPPPPPLPPASPHWPEKDADDAKLDSPAPHKRHKGDPEAEAVPPTGMLFPEDDMEAISDDEDLPDVPMEDVDTAPAPPSGSTDAREGTDVPSAAAAAEGEAGAEGSVSSAMPTATLDFEEIMSDEEELPEYQEFEEESAEEEYIVEEWEEWQKPYSVLEEFQFVAPLVQLCSPALTPHQAAIAAAVNSGAALNSCTAAANPTALNSDAVTNSTAAVSGNVVTQADTSAGTGVCHSDSSSAHAVSVVSEGALDSKLSRDESVSKLVAAVAEGCVPTLGSSDEERESFVFSCEQVLSLLPSSLHLLPQEKITETVLTLCRWVVAGLDMECVMAQPQPVFKIRHLKASVRLCTALCQCGDHVTRVLLNQVPLLHALRALYHEPHMALSIRLLIIRCIDGMLSCCTGVQLFLSLQPKLDLTGYEVLLQLMAATSNTRAKVALAAVLRKLHLLEVLEKLRDDVTALNGLLPPPPASHQAPPPQDVAEPADCEPSRPPAPENKASSAYAAVLADSPSGAVTCEREDEWCGGPVEAMDLDEGAGGRDEDAETDDEEQPLRVAVVVPRPLVASLTSCLHHVLHTFTHAERLLAQPVRYLPVGRQFQVPPCPYDVLQEVFVLLDQGGLLASLALLCTSAAVHDLQLCPASAEGGSSPTALVALVCRLLLQLLHTPHGPTYLAAHPAPSTAIVRALLKILGSDNSSIQPSYSRDALREEKLEESPIDPQELGVMIVEQLYVLQHLDSLAHVHARANLGDIQHTDSRSSFNDSLKTSPDEQMPSLLGGRVACNNIDLQQSVVHLNALAGIMYTHRSKMSLVKTLAIGNYLDHLLPYLMLLSPKDNVETAPLKAACFGYAVELLSATVKLNSDASFLERYAEKICQIIESVDSRDGNPVIEEVAKLTELLPWLSIARKPESFSYDNIPHLVEIFKSRLEQVDKFPGELFTVLRIMENLAIPPFPDVENQDSEEVIQELKYQYSIVQFFSADLTTHLNSFLTKLCSIYPQPGLHVAQLSGSEGGLLLCLLQPTLNLLHVLLKQVIRVRGAAYHDLSSVQPLLSTYLLVTSVPESCVHGEVACSLQHTVLRTLLLYTQPGHNPSTPCDANGLWPQMLLQVIKFCDRAPHTMVAGLCLLTELLPLPLPVSGRQLTPAEQERYVVVRKLWATNLAPVAEDLRKLILNLAVGSHASLAYALRRACVAVADLAPQTVLIVVHPLLDLALQHLKQDPASCNYRELARVLYTLASLSSHAGVKAAVLHLLTTEPYVTLLQLWMSAAADSDVRRPLCLLVLHLCRAQNNLLGGVGGLQWGVPCRELLAPLLECQVSVLAQDAVPHNTLQPLLLSLLDVCSHNAGLYQLKSVLDKRRGCFLPVLNTLVTDLPNSMDALETLQVFLDFISALLHPDSPVLPDYVVPGPSPHAEGAMPTSQLRTMSISAAELCYYMSWQAKKDLKIKQTSGPNAKPVTTGVDLSSAGEEMKSAPCETRATTDGAADSSKCPEASVLDLAGGDGAGTCDENNAGKPAGLSEVLAAALHPLRRLEPIVIDCEGHECLLERLYCAITDLVALLDSCDTAEAGIRVCDVSEEDGGWAGMGGSSIAQQYEQRLVCCPPSPHLEPPRLWLQPPPSLYSSESDVDDEMINVSLPDVLRDCHATDYDLEACVQKTLRGHQSGVSPQKGPSLTKGPAKGRDSSLPSRGSPGFAGRGVNLRSDHFRCRPPNTSRPPSLHVDDFVALESTGHQPTGPTGYNRISFGRGKMLLDCMRGRGNRGINRGENRGGPMPGRFIYRPMYRPDFNSRGMMNRGMRWNFRGGDGMMRSGGPMQMNSQYRQQGPGSMGMRFMRGRGFLSRGAPGGYGDRGGRHMRGQFH